MRPRVGLILFIFLIFIAAGAGGAHERATAKHNYNHHVRPIFVKYCAGCHSTGKIAPMSLMTYGDASPWAAAIRLALLERRMPPWQPEEGVGNFHGAQYLSSKEIDVVVDWATGGTPEGDPVPRPDGSLTTPEWPLGPPDHILEAPAVLLPADVMEETRCTEISVPRRPLRAIDFRPGNVEMVHRAVISMSCSGHAAPLATWVPGQDVIPSPRGFAWIPTGRMYLSIQYRKTWRHDGKELRDQSRVGIYFAEAGSKRIQSLQVNGTLIAPGDLRMFSVYAEDGQRLEVDGKAVLQIDRFEPGWNAKYVFKDPMLVKKGSRISGKAWLEFGN